MSAAREIDRATPSAWRAGCPIGEDWNCGLSCEGRDTCERIAAERAERDDASSTSSNEGDAP